MHLSVLTGSRLICIIYLIREPCPMIELTQSTHKKDHRQLHGLIEKGRSFRNDPNLAKQYKDFKARYWEERAKQMLNKIECH